MLNVGGTMGGRAGVPMSLNRLTATRVREAVNAGWWQPRQLLGTIISWMHRGYTQANAGDLAAAVAFNALVALIPTFLLAFSIAGVFLRSDEFLRSSVYASLWGLPSGAADDALDAVLAARRTSSWLGAISLVAFAWTGAGFVGCLSRSMNRVYGVPGCGYMCEKRRGFFVILAFAVLFMAALLASTVPTLFVRQDLPVYFQTWSLAAGWYQVLGYGVAFVTTALLFGM
ncbi:MAG TPA: YhjD/YihY/BrkB family envelope integrity protein, partial [Dehalococcoidia bacterium]|nr:YhjD/YihY/BrkB family envelope integrity protein [Dehalococcoidia bacterium]